MTAEEPRSVAISLVNALEATLRSPRAVPFEVRDIVDMVMGLPETDLADAVASAHPVTQAVVWSGYRRLAPSDALQVLISVATDAEARAMARTALMLAAQPEINTLVAMWRLDVDAGAFAEVTDMHTLLAQSGLDPRIPWDPARLWSMEQIPDPLRPLFPLQDLPAYQHYCSLMGTFEFHGDEIAMLELIRSAGHEIIVFSGEPVLAADAAAEVAFNEWAIAGENWREAQACGDWEKAAVVHQRMTRALNLFADAVRDGADLSVGPALDDPRSFRNLYATFADALVLVSSEGTEKQLADVAREAKALLSEGMPRGLQPEAVASYDQLRAQVDLLHTMTSARNEPEDPTGPGAVGR